LKIRRVVTAGTREQPQFVDEQMDARRPPLIGNEMIRLLAFDAPPSLPIAEPPVVEGTRFFPPPGGVRIAKWTIPAKGTTVIPEATAENRAETEEIVPGMLDTHHEADGLHATSTVDVQYVISGSVTVSLGNGVATTLEAGDLLIIDGQHHAWRNPGSEKCELLGIFYGGTIA
jgi:mannose-6-phosphate isomerase-like protein (cupin superfamily)